MKPDDKTICELHLLRMLETHVINPPGDGERERWERDLQDILRRLTELRLK